MSRSLPRYFRFEGDLARIVETPAGGAISEVWDEASSAWVRGSNIAELDFKGRPLSEEEVAEQFPAEAFDASATASRPA